MRLPKDEVKTDDIGYINGNSKIKLIIFSDKALPSSTPILLEGASTSVGAGQESVQSAEVALDLTRALVKLILVRFTTAAAAVYTAGK